MNTLFLKIECLVNDFLKHTHLLNACMKADQDSFLTQDFEALEQSDLKKMALNARLSELLAELGSQLAVTDNVLEALADYVNQLDSEHQSILKKQVDLIQSTCQAGLHIMNMNRQVIKANASYIKELVSHLTATPPNADSNTYDQSGVLG